MPDRFSDGDPSNDDPAVSRGEFNRAKPDRYHGGDFQGIINHLPYLKSLGVTALWITPIYDNVNNLGAREPNPADPIGDYHGYGAVDFYGVEEHFGTLALLRELVQKAHALGLKVIQDQVANHTSPFHPWLADPPTPTWYNGTPAHHLDNNWDIPTLADLHAAPALQKTPLEGWFVNYLPDLNQNDPEVARYEIQNTLWWLGTAGFDGVREDTMCYVPRAFWQKWSAALRRQFPQAETVGEVNNGDIGVASFFQGGRTEPDGIDTGVRSLFDFPLYYPLRRVFAQGQPIRDVAYMLGRDTLYADPTRLVTFLGLHDDPRFLHEDGATVEGLKLAQTFLLTTRGIPMLYYGDEIGMNGGPDPDNRRDFPGGWPGDPLNAFTAEGRTSEQNDIWNHVQTLTHLRQSLPALRRGTLTNLYVSEQQYAYARQMKTGDAVVVALNNDKNPATWTFHRVARPLARRHERHRQTGHADWPAVRAERANHRDPARTRRGDFDKEHAMTVTQERQKPTLTFRQIWNMSFGFLGIQFGWGLQLANMSAIYTKLGAHPDAIPLLWLAGPVTGLLVQPVIGAASDRTWNKLGRRRPYFLVGAILSSIALFFMPDSPVLWVAASLLWVLDSSINVSMEPFRAFVADKLRLEQRTAGFVMQSFFIGIGATLANLLPYALHRFGVTGQAASGVPLSVLYSFKMGAAVFLLAVLWTVGSTREDPPAPDAPPRQGGGLAEVLSAARAMPQVMKQLAVVQVLTWLGLFCMWMFFGLSCARHVFGATDPKSAGFDRGTEWGGVCFAAYSVVTFLTAFLLPRLASTTLGRRGTHALALCCGGVGLLSVFLVHTPGLLLLPMVGVGIAWASILSLPYAMLSGALPPARVGVYMGLFNFFIVLPEIVASLSFQPLVKHVFGNDPLYVVMLGGLCLLAAAGAALRVADRENAVPPVPVEEDAVLAV